MLSANRELFANNGHYGKTSVIREFSNNGCSRITDFYWTKLDPLFANFTVLIKLSGVIGMSQFKINHSYGKGGRKQESTK